MEQGEDVHFHHFYSTSHWKCYKCNKAEKEIKGIYTRKEKIKLFPVTDNMTVYVEYSMDLQKPPRTTEFHKVSEYKTNNHFKTTVFLNTSNE